MPAAGDAMIILSGYRGHVDTIEPVLSGWIADTAQPDVPVSLIINIDGRYAGSVTADAPRPDVAAAGLGGKRCGFSLRLPPHFLDGEEHQIAFHLREGRELALPGVPARVTLGPVRPKLIPAAAANVAAVHDLLRRTDAEDGRDPGLVPLAHAVGFNGLKIPAQGFIFYAQIGERLVGYGRLDRGHGEAAVFGVVGLTVLEAYRRKGVGEALMHALMGAAGHAGDLREVWLAVEPANAPALRLYEKLGFIRNANRPGGGWAVPGQITMLWMPGRGL